MSDNIEVDDDFVIYPEEDDEMITPMKRYVQGFHEFQDAKMQLATFIFQHWDNVVSFDRSYSSVRGYLELSLSEPDISHVRICRDYFRQNITSFDPKLKLQVSRPS